MSHFLYIHPCMAGTPDVWKVGVTKTPYSAVRARQKYTWAKFGLDYLYFGRPNSILWLEQQVKDYFRNWSGKTIQGYGTELFQVEIGQLRNKINSLIQEHQLDVVIVTMKGAYTASSSGQCTFGIPGEKDADWYLECKANEIFNSADRPSSVGKRILAKNNYDKLFY
jgi:hypothetical protein